MQQQPQTIPSCTVTEGAKWIWGGCKDLEVAFPNKNEEDDEISDALKHRFDAEI